MNHEAPGRPAGLEDVPRWLGRLHAARAVGDIIALAPPHELASGRPAAAGGPTWADLVEGAGFAPAGRNLLRRCHSLPDVVGGGMRLLVVGLNPSPTAAETGISFARPGNRFWPAAIAAGLVSRDRDPADALDHHGVGFTDLVKRTSRRASELTRTELAAGMARTGRLASWLRPGACVMVGLMGWRAALDRRAVAGWQQGTLGGRPVYVMPSTSGLNARSSLDELASHLAAAGSR